MSLFCTKKEHFQQNGAGFPPFLHGYIVPWQPYGNSDEYGPFGILSINNNVVYTGVLSFTYLEIWKSQGKIDTFVALVLCRYGGLAILIGSEILSHQREYTRKLCLCTRIHMRILMRIHSCMISRQWNERPLIQWLQARPLTMKVSSDTLVNSGFTGHQNDVQCWTHVPSQFRIGISRRLPNSCRQNIS